MNLLEIKDLRLPGIKVLRFGRYCDERGYFTETFRRSDLAACLGASSLGVEPMRQSNENRSLAGVVRGLHFQWAPPMGKLVRTLSGRMVDLFLDIRRGSPTLGKIAAYALPADPDRDWDEWVWIPHGFAHGNYFTVNSSVEYFCTGEYGPGCEAGISPFSPDLDWSLCDPDLKEEFFTLEERTGGLRLSDKDRGGFTLQAWLDDPRSAHFQY